ERVAQWHGLPALRRGPVRAGGDALAARARRPRAAARLSPSAGGKRAGHAGRGALPVQRAPGAGCPALSIASICVRDSSRRRSLSRTVKPAVGIGVPTRTVTGPGVIHLAPARETSARAAPAG